MPEFQYKGKLYYNPVEFLMDKIGGAWKMPVLWRLREKTLRYSQIKKTLPHISDKMLSKTLRDLEADGFVTREIFPVIPPKTEYTITKRGSKVIPAINTLRKLGFSLMKEEGIEESK
ncbi:MAG: helix-turn-helix domain-containing protein [Spirochaetota bacterium]